MGGGDHQGALAVIMCPSFTEVGAAGQTLGVAVGAKADCDWRSSGSKNVSDHARHSSNFRQTRLGCGAAAVRLRCLGIGDRFITRAGQGRPCVDCGGRLRLLSTT